MSPTVVEMIQITNKTTRTTNLKIHANDLFEKKNVQYHLVVFGARGVMIALRLINWNLCFALKKFKDSENLYKRKQSIANPTKKRCQE